MFFFRGLALFAFPQYHLPSHSFKKRSALPSLEGLSPGTSLVRLVPLLQIQFLETPTGMRDVLFWFVLCLVGVSIGFIALNLRLHSLQYSKYKTNMHYCNLPLPQCEDFLPQNEDVTQFVWFDSELSLELLLFGAVEVFPLFRNTGVRLSNSVLVWLQSLQVIPSVISFHSSKVAISPCLRTARELTITQMIVISKRVPSPSTILRHNSPAPSSPAATSPALCRSQEEFKALLDYFNLAHAMMETPLLPSLPPVSSGFALGSVLLKTMRLIDVARLQLFYLSAICEAVVLAIVAFEALVSRDEPARSCQKAKESIPLEGCFSEADLIMFPSSSLSFTITLVIFNSAVSLIRLWINACFFLTFISFVVYSSNGD